MARVRLVADLADVALEFISEGNLHPTARELAKRYYGGKAISSDTVLGVRKQLGRIKVEIERKTKHLLNVVIQYYYDNYKKNPPTTMEEARRCIPIGRGNHPEGLRLRNESGEDLIWQAAMDANNATGNGKIRANADRLLTAVTNGQVSEKEARSTLKRSEKQRQPQQKKLQQRILGLLPGMEP
jgi:hypothetical protein